MAKKPSKRRLETENMGNQEALLRMRRIKEKVECMGNSETTETFADRVLSVLMDSIAEENPAKTSAHPRMCESDSEVECPKQSGLQADSVSKHYTFFTDPLELSSILGTLPNFLELPELEALNEPKKVKSAAQSVHIYDTTDIVCSSAYEASANKSSTTMNDSVIITPLEKIEPMSFLELEAFLSLPTIPFTNLPGNPKKIAEASFSEVYLVNNQIYKIAPLNEHYTKESFYREVAIMKSLSSEVGVCKLYDSCVVSGPYGTEYLRAWEDFPHPENAHPGSFPETMTYGCLIMENCGVDLESHVFESDTAIIRFIMSLTSILNNLETKYKFEHRDMHWGNVMIENGEVKLIDFSISRMEVAAPDLLSQKPWGKDGGGQTVSKVIYTDLNCLGWLFGGDSRVDPQFGVYKRMRRAAVDNWMSFVPKTNELWMQYVLKKLEKKCEMLSDSKERSNALDIIRKVRNALANHRGITGLARWLRNNYAARDTNCIV